VSLELLLSCYLRLVCLVVLRCDLCLLRLIDLPCDCDCDSASEIRRYQYEATVAVCQSFRYV
jgi:hypothetical protein